MNLTEAVCFDDVLLVPQHSEIDSRKDINLTMSAGGLKLDLPVIAAPMDTVCGDEMAITMSEYGGLGVIHRHQPLKNQIEMVSRVSYFLHPAFGSIGITSDYMLDAKKLIAAGAIGLCVDVANGHNHRALEAVRSIKSEYDVHVMVGNVSTPQGFFDLAYAGADSVRVGIGGGSMCTTRIVTGHGLPTLQSIIDIGEWRKGNDINCAIIADGGIRNSGDMVKAFAAGADFIMVGSMLAGTKESPGEIIDGKKVFRGMASKSAQEDTRGYISVVEGAETMITYKGSARNIIQDIIGGLRSGCSYSGVKNLSDLNIFSEMRRVSTNSVSENRPHGAYKTI
jgi:IMP dehydrogenase